MKKIVLSIALIFGMAVVFTSCKDEKKKEVKTEEVEVVVDKKVASADVYQCPMDCEKGKTYDKAGSCPVCKMDLKKKEAKDSHDDHGHKH